MAFDSLSEKLQNIFKNLRGKGRLSEADVKAALKEVKLALLEADVNFKVVKQFIKSVEERAIGQDVMSSLTPGQMVIKIVNEEMVSLMGSETTEIALKPGSEITVIMMAGLQGAGKTTTTAKLAGKFKAKGRKTLLVACDVYRPAAIEQLTINGNKQGVEVFSMGTNQKPVDIAKAAIAHAKNNDFNTVILDTAGRLHVDEDMMNELIEIKANVSVDQTILVVDSMTGQDAVNVASSFNEKVGIDGVILTKLDGDTRGGAALSIKAVTGKPILYVGMGEKLSDLEQFYPDRMASRILGMGDVLTLFIRILMSLIIRKQYRGWKHSLPIWRKQKNLFLWNTMLLKMLTHGRKFRLYWQNVYRQVSKSAFFMMTWAPSFFSIMILQNNWKLLALPAGYLIPLFRVLIYF